MRGSGWLLDAHCAPGGVALWVKGEDGRVARLDAPYRPPFYARPRGVPLAELLALLRGVEGVGSVGEARRTDAWTGREEAVAEVLPSEPWGLLEVAERVRDAARERAEVCTCDVPLETRWLVEAGLFPLARVRFEAEGGALGMMELDGDPLGSTDYPLPPLEVVRVPPGGSAAAACIGRDPDVVVTRGPCQDIRLASREGAAPALRRERSYASYGRVIYQPPLQALRGRWHIDAEHSFVFRRCGLEGLAELSRLSRIPPQRMAASTPGTAISAMEVATALRRGMLVPWRKAEPEAFKTAWQLLHADRGGLVLEPEPGPAEQVAELDFASMYPTLMCLHNISPETLLCGCCPGGEVPGLGYRVCSRRRGIVPETLEPLLERRAVYKRRARSSRGAERLACERRQRALKWVLVTCYGYLGYRNARFGRIEAHESVTALGRAALLRAARMAEEAGFSVVHGMVDCLWLRDAGGLPLAGREGELASLSRAVGRATGVELALEGVYGWIAFPPSRLHPSLAAANRYFGRYLTGRLKVRGLEARRRDAPGVVRRLQADVLGVLARCPDLAAVRAALPEAEAAVRRAVERVRSGRADPSELVVRVVASRERYSGRSPAAAVADALRARGVRLMPGQEARYVWGPEGRPVVADGADGYSPERYEALLLRAGASLLAPFGVGEDALARGLGAGRGGRQARLGEWG